MDDQKKSYGCCIAGGGPAGMMLGLLLARAGVDVLVLEKHADFLRDFRGDTIHPSTLDVMGELGLLDEFLKLPHQKARSISAYFGGRAYAFADFTYLPTRCKFIALMPQWDFLNFLADRGKSYPSFHLRMRAEAVDLIEDDGRIAVGALTCHHDLANSGLLGSELPLLAYAAGQVGDPQIRHRGTIGGSLVHADPAGDLPAVILALDATLVARGPSGTREISAADFFAGLFETALEPGELLTEIRIPKPGTAGWSFQKFTKRAIDWAIVGAAVQGDQVALVHMGSTPLRASAVEQALAEGAAPADAAAQAAEGTSPPEDINADRDYREHLARVLVGRGLAEARSRA